jgi:hypothetical protein
MECLCCSLRLVGRTQTRKQCVDRYIILKNRTSLISVARSQCIDRCGTPQQYRYIDIDIDEICQERWQKKKTCKDSDELLG